MKKYSTLGALCAALLSSSTFAQSQIFLLHNDAKNVPRVDAVSEAGNYSNQPVITDKGVYFSYEVGEAESAQKDIFFYDFTSGQRANVTNTAQYSEYSPTVTPSGDALSAVVVEPGGAQRLWRYALSGADKPMRLVENALTIGYHAWGPSDDLLVFALGEPHQAMYFTLKAPSDVRHVSDNPGRAFSYSRLLNGFTFIQAEQNWLSSFNPESNEVTQLYRLPQDVQDYTWVEDGTIAYASHGRIYQKQLQSAKPAKLWYDLSAHCAGQITRLSYLVGGEKLAFVCEMDNTPE
ncbi:TolB-like translocation protein [Pseudoalteromonas sp. GB56]